MKNKKIKIILLITFSIILIGTAFIYLGITLNKEADPLKITTTILDEVYEKVSPYLTINNLPFTNNFTCNYETSIKNTTSKEEDNLNANYKLLKRKVSLISNYNATSTIKEDNTNKLLLLEVLENNNLKTHLLVQNATLYYKIDNITSNYINKGTNNYFETIKSTNDIKENFNYLKNFIYKSFKNNLKEDYLVEYPDKVMVNDKEEQVNRISIKFTNELLEKINKNILKDLKNDQKASFILESLDKDFKKKKYNLFSLDEGTSITLNIYVDRHFSKVRKIELVNLVNNDESKITYEKVSSKDLIYIISNGVIDEYIEIKDKKITIYNKKDKNIGSIDLENSKDKKINFYLNDDNNHLEFTYENTSKQEEDYEENINLKIKLIVKKQDLIDLEISNNMKCNNDIEINEDITTAILESSLDNTLKEKIKAIKNSKIIKYIK